MRHFGKKTEYSFVNFERNHSVIVMCGWHQFFWKRAAKAYTPGGKTDTTKISELK